MNKKSIKNLIIGGSIFVVLVVAIIILVTVINKPTETPIFQTDSDGTTLLLYNGADKDVVIPKEIKIIGKSAFENNSTIETLEFASGSKIETIARYAFKDCVSLKSIYIPNTVTSIGYGAFQGCTKLDDVNIPESVEVIDANAFNGCLGLNEVNLNDGLTEIGDYAFASTPITYMYFPSTLEKIGKGVFSNCSKLNELSVAEANEKFTVKSNILYTTANDGTKEIILVLKTSATTLTIADNVSKIYSNAFFSAESLRELIIPATVKEIENDALVGCTNLEKITVPFIGTSINSLAAFGSIFGTKSMVNLKEVVVLQGTTVVEKAFKDFSNIVTITLPQNVSAIGNEAFSGCSSLTTINNIPTDLTKINKNSFANCTKLDMNIIASLLSSPTLTIIEDGVFQGCATIRSLVIPENVKHIGLGAFENCSSITEVNLPFIGMGYQLNLKTNELTDEFDTTSTFGYIFGATSASENKSKHPRTLTSVILTSSTRDVQEKAFFECDRIKKVELGNGIKNINNSAFKGCTMLSSLVLPTTLETIGEYALLDCINLVNISLPTTLTQIGDSCFAGCRKLKAIDLTYVTKLGNNVFQNCANLATIMVGSSNPAYELQEIRDETGSVIGSVLFTKGLKELVLYASGNSNATYTIPSETEIIRSNSFTACSNLETLIIPATVRYIQNQAIVECEGLQKLTIPFIGNSEEESNAFENIFGGNRPLSLEVEILNAVEISREAFINVNYITSIILSSNLEKIGACAFLNCSSLTNVDFSKTTNLKVIDNEAFSGCKNIKTLNLPTTITTIGDYAFADLSEVTTLDIPLSLEQIGVAAFRGLNNLTTLNISAEHSNFIYENGALLSKDKKTLVFYMASQESNTYTFPQELENIYAYAFSGAKNLKEVVLPSNIKALPEGLFYNCRALTTVTLAEGTTTISTRAFEGCIKLVTINNVQGIISIKSSAFKGCSSIKNIPLNDKVQELGESAFENCSSIESITVPSSIKEIAKAAFKGCSSLTTINLLEGLETIGVSAFEGCKNISNFKLPNTLKKISASAFRENSSIGFTEIYIPDSVKEIGEYAFSQCSRLTLVYISENVEIVGNEAFGNLPLVKIFTAAVQVEVTSDGTKTYKYPAQWDSGFWKTSGNLFGKGEFKLVNGVPVENTQE